MAKSDYYVILGVSKDSDADTIKKAYRKMAMQFHPDKNPGDKAAEDKFKEAAEAYEVLSNKEKRARYDQFGHAGVNGFGGGQGFHDASDIFEAFGDIFGDFFGGAGGPRQSRGNPNRPRRGSDLRYFLEIDLKEVLTGLEKEISFDAETACGTCHGSGGKDGSKPVTCSHCGGRGQVVQRQGFFSMATPCPACRGEGQTIKDPCPKCRGRGRVPMRKKLLVNVPAGVDNGTQLRLTGEGEEGFKGGTPGDLYVEIRVREHDVFQRQEEHLIAPLEINYIQALLGAEMKFETLRGPETVKVPKGVQPGELIRLPRQGVPSLRGGRVGDLVLEVQVVFPKKLDKEEEKLLKQIADLKNSSVSNKKSGLFG